MTALPQKSAFLDGEGDAWLARNRAALAQHSTQREAVVQRVARQLAPDHPTTVLEIGCGQGANLELLAHLRPIQAHGVDPSAAAVAAGQARNPVLALQVATADALPYGDASFDVVWFGFCLYLVDRPLLQRVVAEADRVLREGGLLAILDFDPAVPCRRAYHHRPGLHSYKMDHARLFLANPAYVLVEKLSLQHDSEGWAADPQERVALSLCRKSLEQAYSLTA
jgi:ubiquinone/menaquinone biosynthesis C-methylase UbiE